MTRDWIAAVVLTGCVAVAACAPVTSSYPPVPPLQAETMTKPPVTTTPLIWQPGHWEWTGGGYAWAPGTWVSSVGHGTMWMPGYWAQGPGGGWVWAPAHWM